MNVWTDIAIANLQRARPNPRDLEESFICAACEREKPASDFRHQDAADFGFVRDKICRECRCMDERSRRNTGNSTVPCLRRVRAIEVQQMVLRHLAKEPSTIRHLESRISASRRTIERTIKALREDGLVRQVGTKKYGTNDRVPIYGRTTPASPAERNSA